ncbi:TIGR04028 family ABC transporter substrate-binding protein [Komagataeibacter sucrofermentans]|nr:TIGR04028 family ABC transporter substrate-binding protein [Komagataeibacter sucrofermentans]
MPHPFRANMSSSWPVLALATCLAFHAPAPARAADAAPPGGTLLYLEKQPHKNLYPPAGGFYPNGGILAQITDRLTWQNTDTLAIEPWIATGWGVNEDSTVFTFTLRPGVTFSDGTPVDAAAVALNYDTFGKGNRALHLPPSEVINNYERSEVIDPLTVRFYFSRPSPGFLQGTSVIGSGLVSPASLRRPLDEWGDARHVIGSGPFVVRDEVPGKSVDLATRPDYAWGPAQLAPQGPSRLAGVRIIVVPEDSIRIGAFIAGQADFARAVEAYDEEQITRHGDTVYAASTRGVNNSVVFRPDNPLVADPRVRLALLHATDRPDILRTLYSPHYPLARSVIAADAQGFVDHSTDLTYDPVLAARLLDEAGWTLDPDGWRRRNGVTLALAVHEALPQPQSRSMLVLLAQQWRRTGVQLTILSGSPAMTVLDNLNPAVTPLFHAEVGRADPDVIKSAFYPTNRNVLLQKGGQSRHVDHFVDPELNGLLDQVASDTDPATRLADLARVQADILAKGYSIPIFEEPQVYAGSARVHDMHFEAVGRPVFYRTWLARP